MTRAVRITSAALAALNALAAPIAVRGQTTWGGYLQTRVKTDYRSTSGFSIRRAKLYTTGIAPFDANLSARLQAIFRWQDAGALTLQDACIDYHLPRVSFRAGQFVPPFSLQRLQSDAVIPVVERALAVDALIPSAETYARDIGVQLSLHPSSFWQLSLGAFNGNGGNQSGNNDRQLLCVARPTFQVVMRDSVRLHLGMSFAYRHKSGMVLKKIFGTTKTFSGDDFRCGGELLLSSPRWHLQAEYLQAEVGAQKAFGYYILGAIAINRTNELVGLIEQLNDLNPAANDAAWYGAGWNHYFAENQCKLQVAGRTQLSAVPKQFATTVQLQLYVH